MPDFEKISSDWAGDPGFDLDFGLAYLAVGNFTEAAERFSAVIVDGGTVALQTSALLNRGVSFLRTAELATDLGQAAKSYAEANRDLDAAVKLDWKTTLGWVYADLEGQPPTDALSLRQSELVSQRLEMLSHSS